MTVTGCTLEGNSILASDQGNGGAVYNDSSATMTVNTSTLTDNSASAAGAISAGGVMTLTRLHRSRQLRRLRGRHRHLLW